MTNRQRIGIQEPRDAKVDDHRDVTWPHKDVVGLMPDEKNGLPLIFEVEGGAKWYADKPLETWVQEIFVNHLKRAGFSPRVVEEIPADAPQGVAITIHRVTGYPGEGIGLVDWKADFTNDGETKSFEISGASNAGGGFGKVLQLAAGDALNKTFRQMAQVFPPAPSEDE